MSALGPSLAQRIKSSRSLMKWVAPLAQRYANLSGYRKFGLKYDDILIEENGTVQKALSRLSERESYDRAYRHRVAHQLAIEHRELPKSQWTPAAEVKHCSCCKDFESRVADMGNGMQDSRYLTPLVKEIENENAERAAWNAIKPQKRGH